MRSVVSPETEADSITPVASAFPPAIPVIVGALVYPLPLSVMITLEILPPSNTAIAVAVLPFPPGAGMVRTGTGAGNLEAYITHASSTNYGSLYFNLTATTGGFHWQVDGTERLKMNNEGKIWSDATYDNTSSGGANVFILDGGELHRSTSSVRYKTNIVDSVKGLTELLTLRPVDFNSLCTSDDPNKLRTGLIAEEVDEAGFDEYVVRDEENEVQSVEYGHMVALCVKAIQELSVKNDALAVKVTALETANTALEARVLALESA